MRILAHRITVQIQAPKAHLHWQFFFEILAAFFKFMREKSAKNWSMENIFVHVDNPLALPPPYGQTCFFRDPPFSVHMVYGCRLTRGRLIKKKTDPKIHLKKQENLWKTSSKTKIVKLNSYDSSKTLWNFTGNNIL